MSRKSAGLVAFGLAITVAAVAGTFYLVADEDAPESNPQGSTVFVDFTRSGGFTGITQHLLVYSDGAAELTTGVTEEDAKTIEFDLAPKTIERLERVLPEAVRILDEEPQSGLGCADCFQYDLIYDDVRYTFFDLPTQKETTRMLDVLSGAICEPDPPGGYCP
jgi:hypothetical protein